jgi:hypothetical protein
MQPDNKHALIDLAFVLCVFDLLRLPPAPASSRRLKGRPHGAKT